MYIAHKKDNNIMQSVKEHSNNVAQLCSNFAIEELKDIAYNTGLLHDIGKYQKSFQKRISGCAPSGMLTELFTRGTSSAT